MFCVVFFRFCDGAYFVSSYKGLEAECTLLIIKPARCTNFSNLFLEVNCTCFGHTGLLTAVSKPV